MSRYRNKILNVLAVGFLLTTFSTLYGQGLPRDYARSGITILQSDTKQLVLEVHFPAPQLIKPVHTEPGYFNLSLPGSYHSNVPGMPDLPVLNRMIEIPFEASYQISVTEMVGRDLVIPDSYMGMELSPVQPPRPKSAAGERPFVKNAEVYTKNEWFDYGSVRILDDGIMRNARIARLSISPVKYQPVTRQIQYLESAVIHITFSGGVSNPLGFKQNFASPLTDPSSVTLNGSAFQISSPITGPVHYVILSDSMFLNTLQPFIAWKKKKGFKVTEVYKGSPGVGSTTTSMKAFLKGIWDGSSPSNPAPTYLLIAGDVAQIPAFNGTAGNHVTDLYYAEYTGDIYPELEYGRYSATSVAQLQAQIDKTLMVEQYSMPSPGYLTNGLLVAGNDATYASVWANGQMYYAENEYVNTSNGMQPHVFPYPASSGQLTQIVQRFNEGVSLVNYSAHGSSSGWSDPAFTSTTVSSLTNTGRYPTVISNACETGKFGLSQCFAESIVRAENKGAVGHIGASDLTYWDEDYYFAVGLGPIVVNPSFSQSASGFYDRLFHTHGEPYSQWWTTQGGIVQAGNLAVTQSGQSVPYYWEIYHLMGDPSLMPWLGIPISPVVSFLSTLPTGLSQVSVQAGPYQYVALSYNGQIHGAGVTDGAGVINLQIQPFTQPANALLSITGQNKIPFFDTIHFVTPTGPFILADSMSYIDLGGNSNQITDAGESILLNVRVKNFTSFASGNLTLKLQITDNYITLTDSLHTLSGIAGMASVNIASAFSFQIKDFVPDQHTVSGVIRIENGSQYWNTPVGFTINSAVVEVHDVIITDFSGNNNGLFEPGEPFEFRVKLKNTGHAALQNLVVNLSQDHPLVQLNIPQITMPLFNAQQSHELVFAAQMMNFPLPKGSVVKLEVNAVKGNYGDTLVLYRMMDLLKENFEDSTAAQFPWIFTGSQPWFYTTESPYEGAFCIRSGNIPNQSSTSFQLDMPVLSHDSIRFAYKVSSEEDYDFLIFSINQQDVGRWSGLQPGWDVVSFPVDSGMNRFTWTYSKDYYTIEGSDCAWIDYIIFPVTSVCIGVQKPTGMSVTFEAYPNPVNGKLQVRITDGSPAGGRILLCQPTGAVVQQHPVDGINATCTFDTGSLPSGIYLLILETPGGSIVRKIIKY